VIARISAGLKARPHKAQGFSPANQLTNRNGGLKGRARIIVSAEDRQQSGE
jgi:hypothetical protein